MLLFSIDTDVCFGVCQPSHYSVEKDERKEHKFFVPCWQKYFIPSKRFDILAFSLNNANWIATKPTS